MNLKTPLSIFAALALVGCTSAPSISQEELDWQQARQTHTIGGYEAFLGSHAESEHRGAAEAAIGAMREQAAHAEAIRANWPKLHKGMTVDQVNDLVGPIDEKSLEFLRDAIDLSRSYGLTSSPSTLLYQSPAGMCRFEFDSEGNLATWSLE